MYTVIAATIHFCVPVISSLTSLFASADQCSCGRIIDGSCSCPICFKPTCANLKCTFSTGTVVAAARCPANYFDYSNATLKLCNDPRCAHVDLAPFLDRSSFFRRNVVATGVDGPLVLTWNSYGELQSTKKLTAAAQREAEEDIDKFFEEENLYRLATAPTLKPTVKKPFEVEINLKQLAQFEIMPASAHGMGSNGQKFQLCFHELIKETAVVNSLLLCAGSRLKDQQRAFAIVRSRQLEFLLGVGPYALSKEERKCWAFLLRESVRMEKEFFGEGGMEVPLGRKCKLLLRLGKHRDRGPPAAAACLLFDYSRENVFARQTAEYSLAKDVHKKYHKKDKENLRLSRLQRLMVLLRSGTLRAMAISNASVLALARNKGKETTAINRCVLTCTQFYACSKLVSL